jgi:hypothetical protein
MGGRHLAAVVPEPKSGYDDTDSQYSDEDSNSFHTRMLHDDAPFRRKLFLTQSGIHASKFNSSRTPFSPAIGKSPKVLRKIPGSFH